MSQQPHEPHFMRMSMNLARRVEFETSCKPFVDEPRSTYLVRVEPNGLVFVFDDAIDRFTTEHTLSDGALGRIRLMALAAVGEAITDEQITQLRREAYQAGDDRQAFICDRALAGSESARDECARVITDARRGTTE